MSIKSSAVLILLLSLPFSSALVRADANLSDEDSAKVSSLIVGAGISDFPSPEGVMMEIAQDVWCRPDKGQGALCKFIDEPGDGYTYLKLNGEKAESLISLLNKYGVKHLGGGLYHLGSIQCSDDYHPNKKTCLLVN